MGAHAGWLGGMLAAGRTSVAWSMRSRMLASIIVCGAFDRHGVLLPSWVWWGSDWSMVLALVPQALSLRR